MINSLVIRTNGLFLSLWAEKKKNLVLVVIRVDSVHMSRGCKIRELNAVSLFEHRQYLCNGWP